MEDIQWTTFCQELLNAPFVPGETSWISGLHHNVVQDVPEVYNFETYNTILNHPTHSPLLDTVRRLFVLGHPGIGKSCMSVVLMKRLMLANQSFLYSSAFNPRKFYEWNGAAALVHTHKTAPVHNANYLWIINQAAHGPFAGAACRWVLLSSPKRTNFLPLEKAFSSTGHKYVYFPLPSAQEVRTVALRVGGNMDLVPPPGLLQPTEAARIEEINRRIDLVGLVPNHVCSATFPTVLGGIDLALSACDFKIRVFDSTIQDPVDDLRHRIFCENATADLRRALPTFVSNEVQRRYVAAWKRQNLLGIRMFLSTNNNTPELSVLYGNSFENYAHSVIAGGGEFPMRVLHKMKQKMPVVRNNFLARTHLSASVVRQIPNNLDLSTLTPEDMSSYLKPISGNFGAVDSLRLNVRFRIFTRVCFLLQMTVNAHHGVNAQELDQLLTVLRPYLQERGVRNIFLVFVVPDYLYRAFKVQAYNGYISAANLNAIEQWVLSISTELDANYAGFRV